MVLSRRDIEGDLQVGLGFRRTLGQAPSENSFFHPVCPSGTSRENGKYCELPVTINDNDTLAVTEVAVSSNPTGDYYDVGDDITFTATFNGNVTVTGTPQLAFDLGGQTRLAGYASGSGSKALVFSYTVVDTDGDDHDGISWGANAISPNGGTIKFTSTDVNAQVAANLDHAAQGALADHKVDTAKPILQRAAVDGATLTLTYNENLNTNAPANNAFTVSVDGGTGVNPTAVSISGSVVELTLGTAVGQNAQATLTYAVPGSNPIRDLSGKEADPLTNQTVEQASDLVNFRATPADREVTLQWDLLTDSRLRRYQYRYMSTADTGWNPDWRDIPGSNASTTSFTARNLTNGIEYTFQVRSVYVSGGQPRSETRPPPGPRPGASWRLPPI